MTDTEALDGRALTLAEITDLQEMSELKELFDRAWGRTGSNPVVPLEVLRAASMSGGYVVGAEVDGRLIAGGFGMLGMTDGQPHLHSHVVAVAAEMRGKGVGLAVKQHQRQWARDRGLGTIAWTFDPLVRRNAYFNLNRLGARPVQYLVNWYGRRNDSIDAGEGDRFLVEWDLTASADPHQGLGSTAEPSALARRLQNIDGVPHISTSTASDFLVDIPDDIVGMRRSAPERAKDWALAYRRVLGLSAGDELQVVGIHDSAYVITRKGRTNG